MSYLTQKTIKNNVSFSGVALHSGLDVNVCIKPAEPNFGIVFKRVDFKENNLVYPNFMNVTNTSLNTTIENEFGVKVSTIEHLMGALFGLGIDNALIEIDNEEVPILDGSAKEFIEKIISSGLVVSEAPIKIIKINKEINFTDGERFISIEPSTLSLDIDFELKYKNPIIGNQTNKIKVFEDDLTDVYNSRTFCLFEDIELIKKNKVATIKLNRPDKLNAFNEKLIWELQEATSEVKDDEDIKVLIITGAGRGFSAGADLTESESSWEGSKDALLRGFKPFFENIEYATTFLSELSFKKLSPPPFLIIKKLGLFQFENCIEAANEMLDCFIEVLIRIDLKKEKKHLSSQQEDELLNWDAEIYRQKIN